MKQRGLILATATFVWVLISVIVMLRRSDQRRAEEDLSLRRNDSTGSGHGPQPRGANAQRPSADLIHPAISDLIPPVVVDDPVAQADFEGQWFDTITQSLNNKMSRSVRFRSHLVESIKTIGARNEAVGDLTGLLDSEDEDHAISEMLRRLGGEEDEESRFIKKRVEELIVEKVKINQITLKLNIIKSKKANVKTRK